MSSWYEHHFSILKFFARRFHILSLWQAPDILKYLSVILFVALKGISIETVVWNPNNLTSLVNIF